MKKCASQLWCKKKMFHSYKDPGSFLLCIIQILIWAWELTGHALGLPLIPSQNQGHTKWGNFLKKFISITVSLVSMHPISLSLFIVLPGGNFQPFNPPLLQKTRDLLTQHHLLHKRHLCLFLNQLHMPFNILVSKCEVKCAFFLIKIISDNGWKEG